MNVEFTSNITVQLLNHAGSDESICRSAWVSNLHDEVDASEERLRGLISSLMKQKHGSPFESGYLEFWIDAPRAVRDEHVRHRIGSYSSSSLRYNHGKSPRLYIPPPWRPMKRVEDFKKMRPEYVPLSARDYDEYVYWLKNGYQQSYYAYDQMVAAGFDGTEDTRWITHDGKMTPYIARFNPRSLMAFLSLRTHDPEANHISYPMWEIEQVARKMEDYFKDLFPITHEAFEKYGRESP